mmetsp:Transcript_5556/g.14209  ORF Transcript_5556/g.14209 Transcript_5556/m.14209 type:complete len:541 (-) Transcript_5556:1024-2646(-)
MSLRLPSPLRGKEALGVVGAGGHCQRQDALRGGRQLHRQHDRGHHGERQQQQPLEQAVEVDVEGQAEVVGEHDLIFVLHLDVDGRRGARPGAGDLDLVGARLGEGVHHADHRLVAHVHLVHAHALQRDHHLVRPPHALRLPRGVRRRHEHRRPVVHDLKADAQRLAAHVARRARGGQREDALIPVARQHVVAALQLRAPDLERVVVGGGFEGVHIAVHRGHQQVHLAVAVQVVREHHRVRHLADVHRVGAPGDAVNHVEQAVETNDDEVHRLGVVLQLGHQDGRHHAALHVPVAHHKRKQRQFLAGLAADDVDLAVAGAKHDLQLPVAVDVRRGGALRDAAARVALPQLAPAVVEQRRVAAVVRRKDLHVAVPVEVRDERLPLDLAHLHRPPLQRLARVVQRIQEAHRGSKDDLHLSVAVDVDQRGRGVRVRAVLGDVRREVQVLRPLQGAAGELERHDAAGDVFGDVQVLAQLLGVGGLVVVLVVVKVADHHHHLVVPVAVDVCDGGRAQDVRIHLHKLARVAVRLLLKVLVLPKLGLL